MGNKIYVNCSMVDRPEVMKGYYEKYSISEDILSKLSRDLGFSYDMYAALSSLDSDTAEKLVTSMSRKNKREEIVLLLDEDTNSVLGYSLDSTRFPVLNSEFLRRVNSLVDTCSEVKIVETYSNSEDTMASILIKKSEPVIVDLGTSKTSYEIGVLLVNNELDGSYSRMVVFIDKQPIYLPASYYNATTNRYKKSTSNAEESLEVLVLKIIDDLRDDELKYKVQDFHLKYRVNKDILTTYEEYNSLLRVLRRVPSIVEDRSLLESVNARLSDFEKKYSHIEDQKSSYIWRCTAMGELTIGNLVHITSTILNDLGAPVMEYYEVRELIGNYLSTNRIALEIAKADS